MEMDKAHKLREAWKARGNPPCDHPEYTQELYLGSGTGDYVCTICGAYVEPEELRNRRDSK
jgi:hypothetical protein